MRCYSCVYVRGILQHISADEELHIVGLATFPFRLFL